MTGDPDGCLRRLCRAIAADLAAVVDPDDPDRMYPTIPQGHATNTLCVAYGAAGVLHALHHYGVVADPRVVDRLRRQALAGRDRLPPGLHFGTAGIGWVLAELGHLDDASALLGSATGHPILDSCVTWGGGTAGVGTALLALHARTGDNRHLEAAARLGEALHAAGDLTELVGPRNAIGLLHGRAGVALFLHQLWRATGDKRHLRLGVSLLHAELDRATPMPGGQLGFTDDATTTRSMVYLAVGAAGVGHVLTRYVHSGADERLAEALPRVVGYAERRVTMEPGLYLGLAGLAFFLADHADLAGATDRAHRDLALELAAGLVKYATAAPGGRARFLGQGALRFSAELWSGSAGVLLALDRVLNGPKGQFFTLDELSPAAPMGTPAPWDGTRGGERDDGDPCPAGASGRGRG